MKRFLILTLLISSLTLFATAQIPDLLIYKGKEYKLQTNPLEAYFEKHPDKRPNKGGSSALWRKYIATFKIKDNYLYLEDIATQFTKITKITKEESKKNKTIKNFKFKSIKKSIKEEIFKKQIIKIDWFTGILVLPYGKMINYVHMGYGSTYENYILLEVQKGKITKKKDLTAKEYQLFKEVQFSEFKKTNEYKKIVSELKNQGSSQEFIDNFLRDVVIEYSSKFLDKK